LILLLPSPTEAWGKEGHQIVANIAYQRLSTKTQSVINDIVQYDDWHYKDNEEELSPLGKIANWADQVRLYYKWSSKLHFVDIRDDEVKGGCHPSLKDDECVFFYERDCVEDGCAVGDIVNYTNRIVITRIGLLHITNVIHNNNNNMKSHRNKNIMPFEEKGKPGTATAEATRSIFFSQVSSF